MAIMSNYSPDIFRLVPMSQLSTAHFHHHPIWSEFYDYEERGEIASWGVDLGWLDAELARMHKRDDHCAYTILRACPLPERVRLYFKACFVTAEGMNLEGYIMNDDAFCATVFVNDQEFTFSRHPILADLNGTFLDKLRKALGHGGAGIFPLRYETDFMGRNGHPIKGIFAPTVERE
jgi:hypothetical protein